MIRFLRYILAYFRTQNMSAPTRADLNAALAALTVQANDVNVQAQDLQASTQAAANRVAALPVDTNDYTGEVALVQNVSDSLTATATVLTATKALADGIAP